MRVPRGRAILKLWGRLSMWVLNVLSLGPQSDASHFLWVSGMALRFAQDANDKEEEAVCQGEIIELKLEPHGDRPVFR